MDADTDRSLLWIRYTESRLAEFDATIAASQQQIVDLQASIEQWGRQRAAVAAAVEAYRASIATPIAAALPPPGASTAPLSELAASPVELIECRSCGLVKASSAFYVSEGRRRPDCKACCAARRGSVGVEARAR